MVFPKHAFGNKRKRDDYEENDVILQKETDARNDG
jgi:hypothetical protein